MLRCPHHPFLFVISNMVNVTDLAAKKLQHSKLHHPANIKTACCASVIFSMNLSLMMNETLDSSEGACRINLFLRRQVITLQSLDTCLAMWTFWSSTICSKLFSAFTQSLFFHRWEPALSYKALQSFDWILYLFWEYLCNHWSPWVITD